MIKFFSILLIILKGPINNIKMKYSEFVKAEMAKLKAKGSTMSASEKMKHIASLWRESHGSKSMKEDTKPMKEETKPKTKPMKEETKPKTKRQSKEKNVLEMFDVKTIKDKKPKKVKKVIEAVEKMMVKPVEEQEINDDKMHKIHEVVKAHVEARQHDEEEGTETMIHKLGF